MSDAKVLADALVEAGMLTQDWMGEHKAYWIEVETNHGWWTAEQIITDWRVAGKVLESMADTRAAQEAKAIYFTLDVISNPRAIIEAWYEAQNND